MLRQTVLQIRELKWVILRRLMVVLSMAFLVACSMASSTPVDIMANQGCASAAGSYQLSKSYLKIVVTSAKVGTTDMSVIREITAIPRTDGGLPYCLDYIASTSSNDRFVVNKVDGLLKKISTKGEDRSEKIAETLVRTVFAGISQNPAFSESLLQAGRALPARLSDAKQFDAEYDPFDADQVAVVNDALKEFGFCLILENEVVDYESYCSNPLRHMARERLIQRSSVRNAEPHPITSQSCRADDLENGGWQTRTSHFERGGNAQCSPGTIDPAKPAGRRAGRLDRPKEFSQGVFYRARLPYNYYLYIRPNMKVMGSWKLRGTAVVYLENRSPVFSVAVDRTFFATRQTTLDFDKGVLQDVTIDKTSELAGFVSIPLLVAQSIAALPANIIQVRIDQTNNRGKLIAAQSALIEQQEKELAMRLQLQEAEAKAKETAAKPSARVLGGDQDEGAGSGRDLALDKAGFRPGNLSSTPTLAAKTFYGCMDGCGDYEHVCRRHCTCVIGCIEKSNEESACRRACPEARGR